MQEKREHAKATIESATGRKRAEDLKGRMDGIHKDFKSRSHEIREEMRSRRDIILENIENVKSLHRGRSGL